MRGLVACVAVVAGLLTGCTSTESAIQAVGNRWIGQSVDDFFSRYGPPSGQYTRADGGIIYSWTDTRVGLNEGSTVGYQCSLQIGTTPARKITSIVARSDSIGMWELSRCNEVLN